MELIGQFVTATNTPTIPHPAQMSGGRLSITESDDPSVAPTKREGTISPPLNPAQSVRQVKSIFNKKIPNTAGSSKL